MTCKELINFLDDYLDGQLPEDQRRVFDEHLQCCSPCVAYLRTYRDTIRITRQCLCEHSEAVPDEVPESLVQAILTARKER